MKQTAFPTRKEALDHAIGMNFDFTKCVSKTLRMPHVWSLWENEKSIYILCTHLYKIGINWTYDTYREGEFKELTCPIKYISLAKPVVDPEWRENNVEYFKERKRLYNEIKDLFFELEEGKSIKVYLKPGWKPVSDLIVEGITPTLGRKDGLGKRFRIKPIAISHYEIINEDDD